MELSLRYQNRDWEPGRALARLDTRSPQGGLVYFFFSVGAISISVSSRSIQSFLVFLDFTPFRVIRLTPSLGTHCVNWPFLSFPTVLNSVTHVSHPAPHRKNGPVQDLPRAGVTKRDADFNKALHGQTANAKGGIAAMMSKDKEAKQLAVDE